MSRKNSGFTLAEVVTAIAIVAMVFGGMMVAYTQATQRAQWSGYSLAAQGLAIQQLEQARSAQWEVGFTNQISELVLLDRTNIPPSGMILGGIGGYTINNLDLPTSGSNYVRATNWVTVIMFYANNTTNPPVQIQMIRVRTEWPFTWKGTTKIYANTICTYTAPDNRDPGTLGR